MSNKDTMSKAAVATGQGSIIRLQELISAKLDSITESIYDLEGKVATLVDDHNNLLNRVVKLEECQCKTNGEAELSSNAEGLGTEPGPGWKTKPSKKAPKKAPKKDEAI